MYNANLTVPAQGHKYCNVTAVGVIPVRGNELLFINIFINLLWYQEKSATLSSATQHAMPLKLGEILVTECLNTTYPYQQRRFNKNLD